TYQGEPALTVTPDLLLVGGYNSIDPGKCSATLANCAPGVTIADASTSTWRTSRIPIAGNLLGFDPSTAADSANKVYYSYGSCSTGNLMVAVSDSNLLRTNSGTAVSPWTASRVTALQSGVFDDKPWIAADPAAAGLVYVAWDRNQYNNQTIYVTRSNKSNGA